jgi:hypothetical protein
MSITTTKKYCIGAYNVVTNQFPFAKMYPISGFYDDGETFASSLTHQVARAFADIPGMAAKIHVRQTSRSDPHADT